LNGFCDAEFALRGIAALFYAVLCCAVLCLAWLGLALPCLASIFLEELLTNDS
jgi:hypothetical protein